MKFLIENNFLYENQFYFQKGKSTTLAILDRKGKPDAGLSF